MFYYLFIAIIFIPLVLLFPTKIINRKRIPKKGGVLLCGNHQSGMDVFLFALHFRKQKFMAKKELTKNPIIHAFLSVMGCIFVDRKNPGIEAYKKVCKHLNNGGAMNIFPEGTRGITPEESLAMKNGVAMFALKTSSPVVPIAVIKKPAIFRKNYIIVGNPFYFDKVEKITKEVLAENSKILSSKILELRNEFLKNHPKIAMQVRKQEEKLLIKKSKIKNKK